MKNRLKILVQHLTSILNGDISTRSIQKISVFISVLCAIYTLKKEKHSSSFSFSIDYSKEIDIIKKRFSCLYNEYQEIDSSLSNEERVLIHKCLCDMFIHSDANEKNIISWIYQYLKKDLEKQAFGVVGKDRNKIKGADILFTTQFFTDDYMVEYLVDKIFEIKDKQIPNVLFVDPASGGGNFLTYTFDRLYSWYRTNTELSIIEIVDTIFTQNIAGYDLDNHLSKIAALSLFINASKHAIPSSETNIFLFGGVNGDLLGYLSDSIKSISIKGKSYNSVIVKAKKEKRDIAYITNPPFMGKRDMDVILKNNLLLHYPSCKGDLCVSFINKLLNEICSNDIVAVVSQNGWLNLSSLNLFRKKLLEQFHIHECVDLGSNAFLDINGEKTNVVLCIFSRKSKKQTKSIFINLKPKSYKEKIAFLKRGIGDTYEIDSSLFTHNPSYEICYQLGVNFNSLRTLPTYGQYARCMQGTSTGNNKAFVKCVWEKSNDLDWCLVSKGGGYSKWHGLNYYVVKWGKDASLIKSNKGSAIRNLEYIDSTELVYSDTGTLGLNVRLLKPNQVFIASGPGIKINAGIPVCHLAFLNSRVATFLLKARNPKFTISAGYISALPIVESILFSPKIKEHADKCINSKSEYIGRKLPNIEFRHIDYLMIKDVSEYIDEQIIADITNDYNRYEAETAIDIEILRAYKFSKTEKEEIFNVVGGLNMTKYNNSKPNIEELDYALTSTVNENCFSLGRKINGYAVGSESWIETVSYDLGVAPCVIVTLIKENICRLVTLRKKYEVDLLHKIILKVAGIEEFTSIKPNRISVKKFCNNIKKQYPLLYSGLNISESRVNDVVNHYHSKSFLNHPILQIINDTLVVEI